MNNNNTPNITFTREEIEYLLIVSEQSHVPAIKIFEQMVTKEEWVELTNTQTYLDKELSGVLVHAGRSLMRKLTNLGPSKELSNFYK